MDEIPNSYGYLIKRTDLNEHFQCGICEGYMIDATTISECLHSFCKSCIVHFIKTIDHKCPTCNCSLDDLKACIQFDSSLQRLIYKLVPELLHKELERRESFSNSHKENDNNYLNKNYILNIKLFNTQNDDYFNNNSNQMDSKENLNQESARKPTNITNELNNTKEIKVKYIQCIAQTPIRILTKLLRNKYSIPLFYKIKLSHHGHVLDENENLLEVFTSFIHNKDDIFEIKYELVLNKVRQISRIQDKENNQNPTSKITESNNKPIASNKLVNTDFLKVRLKKPNSNTSSTNNLNSNNFKNIKKTTATNIDKNKSKTELIKNSIDSNDISLTTKFKKIKKRHRVIDDDSSSEPPIYIKSEAEIPERRLSNGSDKSFKTTDETNTAFEESLNNKNLVQEKMDISNDSTQTNQVNLKNTDSNNNDNDVKNYNDSENKNGLLNRQNSEASNSSSSSEKLIIDDEKSKNSDSNDSDQNKKGEITLN